MRCGLLFVWCSLAAAVSASAQAPWFTVHPGGYSGPIGSSFTLTGIAWGDPAPTYQWQRNGVNITGATNTTLTITGATEADTGVYGLVATNPLGTATSSLAGVVINRQSQTLSMLAATSPIPAGTSVRLGPWASSWLPVTLTLVSGAATLAGDQLTGYGGSVVIRATQAGDATYAPATLERTYTFVAGGVSPFLTATPQDQTVTAGASVTLRAAAVGSPAPTYQWYRDGTAIAGATHGTFALAAATLADAGRYRVDATNASGTASATATLTVRASPVIVTAPQNQSVPAGTPATFTVTATGFPVPTYQWRRDGVPVPGATEATFTIASPRNSHEGRYDVVVANELGSATSTSAVLDVDMRDVTGTYFGQLAGTTGVFALHAREDGTAALLAHLPGLQTGIVALDVTVDAAGNFAATITTVAGAPEEPGVSPLSGFDPAPRAGAPRSATLRGTLDEATGALTGALAELGVTLQGSRAARTGAWSAQSGFYRAALAGSADGRGYIVVAPDGQAFVFTATGSAVDSASGRVGDNGRLRLTTSSQAVLDVGFANGLVSGTVRLPNGTTGTIAGSTLELAGRERLINLSVRSATTTGSPLITGFVISGSSPKRVLLRAAGPALGLSPFNMPNTLANPSIQLLRGNTAIAQNDNWGTPSADASAITQAVAQAGAFPFRNNSADAALLQTLAPGAYTVTVSGGNGVVLAEIYEVLEPTETAGSRRLVNVSARGPVTAGSPLIAGFVISGSAPQRVLVRGIGPALARAPFNLSGTLPDPQLTLFRGSRVVKSNDAWFRDPDAALIRSAAATVGAFELAAQSLDSAMLVFLEPGAYTAQVAGTAGTAAVGTALVEVYEVGL